MAQRTLLEADNPNIYRQEVGQAFGTVITGRLSIVAPTENTHTIIRIPILLNHFFNIRAKLFVQQTTGAAAGNDGFFEGSATFKNSDGFISQVGVSTSLVSHTNIANWSLTFVEVDRDACIQCTFADYTAETGTTIWTCYAYTHTMGEL